MGVALLGMKGVLKKLIATAQPGRVIRNTPQAACMHGCSNSGGLLGSPPQLHIQATPLLRGIHSCPSRGSVSDDYVVKWRIFVFRIIFRIEIISSARNDLLRKHRVQAIRNEEVAEKVVRRA